MAKLGRHSPTIVNAAWGAIFMWDGRLATLEEQALGPIQSAGEMNMPLEQLMERLTAIPEYKPLFDAAFRDEGMKPKTLAEAIATYERTVVSERAPFDAWIEGNEKAISEEAKRGFALFNGKALCSACHEGWNFTNDGFQDIGLPSDDVGRGEFMPGVIKMQHAFKTPGLREIARRSPYMHDGSLATLEAGRRTLRSRRRRPAEPLRPDETARPHRAGKIRAGCLPQNADQQPQSDRRAGSSPLIDHTYFKDFPCANSLCFALVILAGLSAGALAATQVIHQQGRVFSSESVTIKKGEALTFLNDDSVPHNIMSATKGNEFNLGSQPPGTSTDVTFKEAGDVQVICAIHPRMKMMVKVTD